MKLFFDKQSSEVIQKKAANLIDNDFLSKLFHDEEILEDTLELFSKKKIYLYPFTEFEFLRDVYLPEQRKLKEEFINKPVFGRVKEKKHLEIFPKLYKNALILSRIYAHQGHAGASSFIDLLLGGLLMFLKGKTTLITGNKKHFPSCVFDTAAVLNVEEQTDGNMRAFCIVVFDQEKFDSSLEKLEKAGA